MFHFFFSLELLASFNKPNLFWCSIFYIILLRLMNVKKSLEQFFAAFQTLKTLLQHHLLLIFLWNWFVEECLYLFVLVNHCQRVCNNFDGTNNLIAFCCIIIISRFFIRFLHVLTGWSKNDLLSNNGFKVFDIY